MTATKGIESEQTPFTDFKLRLAAWLVAGALFMEALDSTIITTALPAIARSFETTALRLNVGITVYMLAQGIFIPISAWVADRVGTRSVFATAIILFTASSAGCGLTSSLVPFAALRILQGAAGAMMTPVGRMVVMRFTPRERLMATISAMVWPALIAPVLGPPIGGFVTTHFGWRWIFYLNVPVGLVALAATLAIIPQVRGDQNRPFDTRGFLLCSAGIFALLLGFEWIVATISIASVSLMIAGVALVFLAIRHFSRVPAPMIGLHAYRIETFRLSVRGGSAFRMAIGSAPFLLPLLFQVGFGLDAFHSGLLVFAVFAGNLSMKSVTTPILKRFGFKRVMITNGLLAAATLAACALLTAHTSVFLTLPLLFLGGLSRSMQFTSLASLTFSDVPKTEMNNANVLFTTILQIGMASGITFGALSVHVSQAIENALGLTEPDLPYRWAFLFTAALVLVGLIDVFKLPREAGDSFLARSAKPAPGSHLDQEEAGSPAYVVDGLALDAVRNAKAEA